MITCGATDKIKINKVSEAGTAKRETSEDEHKFTQLRGLWEKDHCGKNIGRRRKANRKFIQLRRLVGVNSKFAERRHGVSPYNNSDGATVKEWAEE